LTGHGGVDLAPEGIRERFVASLAFPLDDFQRQALDLLDAGRSVLVAAPTGSGKTVVAHYAVARALDRSLRAFYTTPLKALSNQKYRELAGTYGPERVGLLTGDVSRNGGAPVVVMTTEVLRNMIYARPHDLHDLGCVVLDEVHYLEDPYRGSVWEEIILAAPAGVELVCLSATVSNAEELARWITTVRGATGAVIEERRPIELRHLFVVGRRAGGLLVLPTFVDGKPNPAAAALDRDARPGGTRRRGPRGAAPGLRRPRRVEVVERFAEDGLLPAIYFVFSRAGCDEAVRQCLDAGVRLTSRAERRAIREAADRHVDVLSDADLAVLGYGPFREALESGVAPHHAGLVPPFREVVEELFNEALVKVVFATETLALGINMPARSVVVEALSKFGGHGHADLTPGEYTQLTGRAGRRGIDEVGYAAVLWSPFHSFAEVAALASARSRALRSSFRPTYNMAVNLVRRYERHEAFRLVRSSFAQYLSDAPLERQLEGRLRVLEARGYVQGWAVTPWGERLAGLYHDCDLLVAEAMRAGLLDGLDAPSLAALVSLATFEARRSAARAELAGLGIAPRAEELLALAGALREEERAARLPPTRSLDAGFARLAFEWARGASLRHLLAPEAARRRARRGRTQTAPISPGDFVRNVKQLVDLLRQIAVVAHDERCALTARRAADQLERGVVAASSRLEPFDGERSDQVNGNPP